MSSSSRAKSSAAPRPYSAIIRSIAKSRFPGDFDCWTEARIRFTSCHGITRTGCSMIRTLGAITQLARSRRCRPVLRRKRRNDLSAVHAVAIVRLDWRAVRSFTKASRSAAVIAETALLRRFNSERKEPATSTSRLRVPAATPR